MPRDPEFDKLIYGSAGKPPPTPRDEAQDVDAVSQFKEGALQGLLNVPESLGQLAEKGIRQIKPDFTMPFHEQARNFRNRVESSPAGIGGEVAGSVLPSFIPGIGAYTDLTMLARSAPTIARAGMGAAQGLISRPVSSKNAGDNEYFTQGAVGGALGALGAAPLARWIPPNVGYHLYHLPAQIKHLLAVSLLRGIGRVPPRVGATAAGAVTPEPDQPRAPPLRFTVPGNPQ